MKVLNVCLLLIVTLLMSRPVVAQNNAEPMTFSQFKEQKDLQINNGFYTVYRLGDKYYLESPMEGMGKEVLITTQVVRGYSAFLSETSGVVRFSIGKNNRVQVVRNRVTDVAADSTDFCMANAIRKSGLVPVDFTLPIAAWGEDKQSVIIELTNELNNPGSGLFKVSSYSLLSHPDPNLSGIDGFRMLNQGVVFSVTRTQSDFYANPQMQQGSDVASTFALEMVIQQLPEHSVTLKASHLAYGFETIGITEYDTKRYVARKKEYIQRWHLSAPVKELRKQKKGLTIEPENQICVYIDPITPAPFVESIKKAMQQWEKAFESAGWKNVFRYSSEAKDAALTYRTILFRCGNAFKDVNFSMIDNPVNG